ncbi:MAG: bifunctional nuclease domain-containing protein [bacterium]
MISVKVHGVAVDDSQENFFVLLNGKDEESDRWLPVPMRPHQIRGIITVLNEEGFERPLTHDLLADVIEKLDARVEKVTLEGDSTREMKAHIYLKNSSGKQIKRETTPSDALALALHADAQIVVPDHMMARVQPEFINGEAPRPSMSSEMKDLQKKLEKAVDSENYERAAQLRDRLRDQARREQEATDLPDDINDELRSAYFGDSEEH